MKSDIDGTGGLWMRADAGETVVSFDNMQDRRVKGQTDWAHHEIVLDVPEGATKICFGFLLTGAGRLWADDLHVEVLGAAGNGPATTGIDPNVLVPQKEFVNGGFEEVAGADARLPKFWGGGGKGYRLTRDEETKLSGAASGRIEETGADGEFGTFTQMFPAKNFLGKRVRLRGWLKTLDAHAAGLWMRVDGPDNKLLGFDNMQTRPVKATTDWTGYSIVLDVPQEATDVAMGFLSIGDGVVWGDDLRLEVVAAD